MREIRDVCVNHKRIWVVCKRKMDRGSYFGNKLWTDSEEKLLLDRISQGMNIPSIATLHERTVGAINSRRLLLAHKLHSKGDSVEIICIKTGLPVMDVNESIKKENLRKQNRETRPQSTQIFQTQQNPQPQHDLNQIAEEISLIKKENTVIKEDITHIFSLLRDIVDRI